MADNKIGGLPVTEGGRLVGIITETDIFKTLLELLGARKGGVRVTVSVREGKGVLARITQALADLGANIISVATYHSADDNTPRIVFKLDEVEPDAVRRALGQLDLQITDFRTT